jgi:hypothetical protein
MKMSYRRLILSAAAGALGAGTPALAQESIMDVGKQQQSRS